MRKGKGYRQLVPYCLAPDFPLFLGLPQVVQGNFLLKIGDFQVEFKSPPADNFVEVIPGTWVVKYHGKSTAGVFTLDWNVQVIPSQNEPGIRILFGGILEDGSLAATEGITNYFESNVVIGGGVISLPPYRSIVVRGIITDVLHVYLFPVPYHLEP